jgi:uncharacterized membrane protein/protein-disulfide isomerase
MNHSIKRHILGEPGMIGRVCLVLAAMCSLYLSSISMTDTPLYGCGADSSCYTVIGSHWAFLFGIPASFIGIAIYLVTVLAAGAFEAREHRTWLGLLGEVCVILVTVGSVWFLAIQFVALRQFCAWCCLTHLLAMLGVFGLTWQRRNHPQPDETRADSAEAHVLRQGAKMAGVRIGAVACGVALLAAGPFVAQRQQALNVAHTSDGLRIQPNQSGFGPLQMAFAQGKIAYQPSEMPLVGNPNAKEFVALLTDYTCDYCRQYAAVIDELVQKRGSDFAVVLLPAARDDNASKVQHTMLCLFREDREKYQALSQQLWSGVHPAGAEAVRLSAQALLGPEVWTAAERKHTNWATTQILATRKLHEANQVYTNSTRLPQLLAGNQILVGYYEAAERLNAFVESSLHPDTPAAKAALAAAAATPVAMEPTPVAVTPQLVTKQNFQDLGAFKPGQKRVCTVNVLNSGNTPMKISWIGLDAGCELLKMPREAIPTGGAANISLNVQAPEQADVFLRKINIHTNAPEPIIVSVQGRVSANPGTKSTGGNSAKAVVHRP